MKRGFHGSAATPYESAPESAGGNTSSIVDDAWEEYAAAATDLFLARCRATPPAKFAALAQRAAASLSHLSTVVSAAAAAERRSQES